MKLTLLEPISSLRAVGTKWQAHYERLGCRRVRDLLFHYPSGIINRANMPALHNARVGEVITQIVTVHEHKPSRPYSKTPYKVICSNQTGTLEVVYFRSNPGFLRKCFPIGKEVLISGKVEYGINAISMPHPDIIAPPSKLQELAKIEPQYPLTYGITSRWVRDAVREALAQIPNTCEWLPKQLLQERKWPIWKEAMEKMHAPANQDELLGVHPAADRLAFDEILASQLALRLRRAKQMVSKQPLQFIGELVTKFHAALPFTLTEAQQEAIAEIKKDQQGNFCMNRMLQGDVGSGKTVVAITAMLNAIEAGKQAVLMVPTEILAKQHSKLAEAYSAMLGVHSICILGSDGAKDRKEKLALVSSGQAQLIIGTHTLFQNALQFADLGLVVIDEQHRFGVEQRTAMLHKGMHVDLLMMSATPIPRTLNMIAYGDLDISLIKQKPSNRLPINTSVIVDSKLGELVSKLTGYISEGKKAYWICPLIEESEKLNLVNVVERFETLEYAMPGLVGLIHGQMKIGERDKVMEAFIRGEIQLLVATTVIEVGVDVPDATIMVIEHAERFGLAQLHQLRGRVGRGEAQSQCILMYKPPLSPSAYSRLQTMRRSTDGFYIAEEDLALRGGGEFLGTKQSGLPEFRNYDLFRHNHLLDMAVEMSHQIISADPSLSGEYADMQLLLAIYGYDQKMALVA